MPPNPSRFLYISLEFCHADLFSGNGVCARSQVLTLAAASHAVDVVCARPTPLRAPDPSARGVTITPIPVSVWRTTDRTSDHHLFANGAAAHLTRRCDAGPTFWSSYNAVLAVDWTGANVLAALPRSVADMLHAARVPVLFLNFRAYLSMSGISPDDRNFYRAVEAAAIARALRSRGGAVVSLCAADNLTLQHLLLEHDPALARLHGVGVAVNAGDLTHTAAVSAATATPNGGNGHIAAGGKPPDLKPFRVLAPPLRNELAARAASQAGDLLGRAAATRPYLSCVVRLSADKGVHRFVALVEALSARDATFWTRTGLVPLLAGAASQDGYATNVRKKLRDAMPHCVIVDEFVGPSELGDMLARSRLNVHPATYEAYGMTIVEAAAMGCPSVVHQSGIGAAQQLLRPDIDAVFATDVEDVDRLARCVETAVTDERRWKHVAAEAFRRATSWTERAHVHALLNCIDERRRAGPSSTAGPG